VPVYLVYDLEEGHRGLTNQHLGPIEDGCVQREHRVRRRSSHLLLLDHLLAVAGSAAFLLSFLAGAALA
jgi:hypothetical protein